MKQRERRAQTEDADGPASLLIGLDLDEMASSITSRQKSSRVACVRAGPLNQNAFRGTRTATGFSARTAIVVGVSLHSSRRARSLQRVHHTSTRTTRINLCLRWLGGQ